ncbi:MAG: hypothetical protein Q8T13_13740 [Acidobacteriota bacterium]|nr:hypothetical protein [Acidobacteriota bacterium]
MATPTAPRLIEAARAGEILAVEYAGGSQPGAVREIAPVVVAGDYVVARDLACGFDKTYRVDKITIRDSMDAGPRYVPGLVIEPRRTYLTIEDVIAAHGRQLNALGWPMNATPNALQLLELGKHGKLKKAPVVAILHEPITVDFFDDFDGAGVQRGVSRPSKRPFHVYSKHLGETRTFGILDSAVRLFLKEAGIES